MPDYPKTRRIKRPQYKGESMGHFGHTLELESGHFPGLDEPSRNPGGGEFKTKYKKPFLHQNFTHVHFLSHTHTAQGNADF